MAILLADDDVQLATFLSKSLESEGFTVHTALDEGSVIAELKRQNYQLIILDLNLGRSDGVKLLEELRTHGIGTPVMVLSARDRVTDRVQSLNSGADDYVTKPFSFQELAARVKAVLRRKADPALSVLRVEDLELDPAMRRVHRGSREIRLSPKEFELLFVMMRRAGEVVGRQDLLRDCWGGEPDTDSNLVDVYVNYLRKKIDAAEEPKLIQTVRGTGYRLGGPVSAQFAPLPGVQATHAMTVEIPPGMASPVEAIAGSASAPLAALVHSIAHDLAQPLTTVRCYLEIQNMPAGKAVLDRGDLVTIEQQADRAIALSKGISALVREAPVAPQSWVDLDSLLNEAFAEFATLVHSKLLIVRREWEAAWKVSSNAAFRQLLVFAVCKLVGRNTRPLVITFSPEERDGRTEICIRWAAGDEPAPMPDATSIFAKDLPAMRSLLEHIGASVTIAQGGCELSLSLPSE
ncbi:MAG TPA: winged helix-turn-helix domain-containing protein [Candidatus Limnocylindrales bacterium]|nr:winged helix-turn-helix domain-containing protein [Candidatus Limnocylindrales bacterium]